MSRVDTILPADSVEFCPAANATDIFAVGTYKLEDNAVSEEVSEEGEEAKTKSKQRRWGRCLVYQVKEGDEWCVVFSIYGRCLR